MGCCCCGVLFCIDVIQQFGVLFFDVQVYDCVFVMVDGYKWMFGFEGLGVFYCYFEQCECLVLYEYGWYMLEYVFDYECCDWWLVCSVWCFECGSLNMFGVMVLEVSLGLLEEVGMEWVGRDIVECVQWLQDGLLGIFGVCLYSLWNLS